MSIVATFKNHKTTTQNGEEYRYSITGVLGGQEYRNHTIFLLVRNDGVKSLCPWSIWNLKSNDALELLDTIISACVLPTVH